MMKDKSIVVKASLLSILQPEHKEELLSRIQTLVIKFNQVVTAAYFFAKYILLHEIEFRGPLIKTLITKDFFQECLLEMIDTPRSSTIKNDYRIITNQYKKEFLTTAYINYTPPKIKSPHQLCDYEATKMLVAYTNNIQCHLGAHIRKTINILVDLKTKKKELSKELEEGNEKRKQFFLDLSQFKREIAKPIETQDSSSIPSHLKNIYNRLFPVLQASNRKELDMDTLWYDIACNSTDYFYTMYLLSQTMENHFHFKDQQSSHLDQSSQYHSTKESWFSAFPTRTSHIPCYLTLEHKIIRVTVLEQPYKAFEDNEAKEVWWNMYFRIKEKPFHAQQNHKGENAFTFEGTMYTDGVGVSILKQRTKRRHRQKGTKNKTEKQKKEEKEKNIKEKAEEAERKKTENAAKRKREDVEQDNTVQQSNDKKVKFKARHKNGDGWSYITYWESSQCEASQGKCILIDPNRRDLLYAMHENSIPEKPNILKYTWNRQRKEMDTRGHRRLRLKLEERLYSSRPELREAVNLHSNTQSAKSTTLTTFVSYLRSRSKISHHHNLETHYEQLIFRKLKWSLYSKKQKCERRMVGLFESKFGRATDGTILIFGDHSRSNMKHQVAVRGKSLHHLFESLGGYQCALMDEFRTSSYCAIEGCNSKVELFMKRNSPRPWKRHLPARKIHGLLRCTNQGCHPEFEYRIWNRDTLAVCNFRRILFSWRETRQRPSILCRNINHSNNGSAEVNALSNQ